MRIAGNEFNRSELAGAFGDLGTLVPFVVGYITINETGMREDATMRELDAPLEWQLRAAISAETGTP
jgi:hypothetical protein